MNDRPRVTAVPAAQRVVADPTPGKRREQAIDVEGGPGDFVHIPKHLVHREVNAGTVTSREIISRSGSGPLTINVDGPDPESSSQP